ncbi:MAG: acyltransferase, partial [Coleofasciculus sp. S288]|nr:acyltransferase [Coleofasciculus sp. S288]
IHLMVVEACQIIGNRVFYSSSTEVSTLTLLGISILSFLISWIATSFLINKKGISKLIFGN